MSASVAPRRREWGAFLLAIGGTAAALVQALGHVRAAGALMLAVNIVVAILSLATRRPSRG